MIVDFIGSTSMITRFFFRGKGHRKTKAQVGSLGALQRTGAVGSGAVDGDIRLDRSSSKVHSEKNKGPPDDGIYKNFGRLFG